MIKWRSASVTDLLLRPRDDLDPGLVHCLEPCGLHLGILVRDRADGVVAPAVLIDLARVPLDAL
jgi:hypothetical protein